MSNFDWQTGLALICVTGAVVVIARRVRALFGQKSGSGCGSSKCGGCASPPTLLNLGEQKGFVSFDALTSGKNSGPDFTHSIKPDAGRKTPTPVEEQR
jgi:hypothetical protein